MKTCSLLLALVSTASLGIGILPATNSYAQMTPQQRAEAEARARAAHPTYQPHPPQQRPVGGSVPGSRQNGDGTSRQSFVQIHPQHEMWRRNYYVVNQILIDAWIAANDHIFVHAQNADGSAAGDADGYDWDEVSTDAVQACIDNADASGVDDSTCQITSTNIG